MQNLINKRILLGITGGIAAYKGAEIVRRLQDAGAQVRVVMTNGAQAFITPLTMQALSGNPVHTDLLDPNAEAAMGHIELSRWCDLVLIAPTSANFMSKLVSGEGSDLLSTLCLATRSPIAIAPAMNQGMWLNESTQQNLATLKARGIEVFGPASGEQACGDVGPGRMIEPEAIATKAASLFDQGLLQGLKVVVTAGPTREALDPVRYISNHSSGKMGYAIAEAAAEAGALTTLVTGPVNITCPDRVTRIDVVSALQMHEAVLDASKDADIFISTAAVADYRPKEFSEQKLKKQESDTMSIELVKNPDIIASVSERHPDMFTVGFAAETENIAAYAQKKLKNKKLDMIVANDVSDKSIGFNSDANAVTIIDEEHSEELTVRSKAQLARDLVSMIANRLGKNEKDSM